MFCSNLLNRIEVYSVCRSDITIMAKDGVDWRLIGIGDL